MKEWADYDEINLKLPVPVMIDRFRREFTCADANCSSPDLVADCLVVAKHTHNAVVVEQL